MPPNDPNNMSGGTAPDVMVVKAKLLAVPDSHSSKMEKKCYVLGANDKSTFTLGKSGFSFGRFDEN